MQLSPKAEKYRKDMLSPVLFRLFSFTRLPLAWFAGLRLHGVSHQECQVSLPYGWRSQNPFQSIYFAALSMAAEMSTGALVMLAIEHSGESIAMLVTKLEAQFTKKADGVTYFTCTEGQKIFDAIAHTCQTGEPVEVRMETIGRLKDGTEVARFWFTWSVKRRARK